MGQSHATRQERRTFWGWIHEGCSPEDAAGRLGRAARTGRQWFLQAGGVIPDLTAPSSSKSHRLTIEEREVILAGISTTKTLRQIGREIGRPASTVSREIARNLHHQRYSGRGSGGFARRTPLRYSPHQAQLRADRKACRPKTTRLMGQPGLRLEVQRRLRLRHSPEQISARLRVDFPDQADMRVSHEAIYQAIYTGGGGLTRELSGCLRTGRALRKPRRREGQRRPRVRIKDMVPISQRPAEVAERATLGHWEGDLIIGSTASGSAIGTLVERATGFVLLLHLPHDHTAASLQQAIAATMGPLPQILRRTLTWDQGIEMANHAAIAAANNMDVYFCDPHSPWQRGSNENTNGLLRQYFPKSTDLSGHNPDHLDFVAAELNARPRKRQGWRTPAEELDRLLSLQGPPGVALTA